ncbi:MAG: hypothetical protein ACT4OK_13015 [Gemmobacter sp.]
MDYTAECKLGREHATEAMNDCRATGNVPKFVRTIRDAAKDESGYGVGFLYALGCEIQFLSKGAV